MALPIYRGNVYHILGSFAKLFMIRVRAKSLANQKMSDWIRKRHHIRRFQKGNLSLYHPLGTRAEDKNHETNCSTDLDAVIGAGLSQT